MTIKPVLSLFKQSLMESFQALPKVLSRSRWFLLAFMPLFFALNQYLIGLEYATKDDSNMTIVVALLGMLVELTQIAFLIVLAPLRVDDMLHGRSTPFWVFMGRHIKGLTVETLRAMVQIILWGLLLIIPGLFKQLRYSFVPFVVMFSPRYEKGEVDALAESNDLVKGMTWLLLIISALGFALDLGFYSLERQFPFVTQPIVALGLFCLTLVVSIYTYILLFTLYRHRAEGKK